MNLQIDLFKITVMSLCLLVTDDSNHGVDVDIKKENKEGERSTEIGKEEKNERIRERLLGIFSVIHDKKYLCSAPAGTINIGSLT